ncbi:MAG: SDR family oxidoreductase [Rhodospirillaceae bacterium]|nr:MAG: SDR family oxidoreductase [Rhodospirillaceae bacterium]
MGRLSGKAALVTGAGQGIGLGIARTFAAEGANLVITGRNAQKLDGVVPELLALGVKVVSCPGDAGSRSDAQRAVKAAIDAFGRLDILVNNAQDVKPGRMLEDTDDEIMKSTVGSGLYGTLYHMQAAFPHFKASGGSIINFGSREGIMGGVGFAAYAATKEAIRGLSRVAAREWGKYGIRINVICPAALSPPAAAFIKDHPDQAEIYRKDLSLGYFGDPEKDIGPAALFLASDDSRYVTGQTINVDGGQVML